MKYIATVIMPQERISETCDTVNEAKKWLDENNNNHEFTTTIGEIDDNNMVVDWFFYTVVERKDL